MIIHSMICSIVILGESMLNAWCRMRMRPARLVSYAFLYTTKPDFFKQQKTLQCFLFQIGGNRTPKSLPRKVGEKSGKVKFHTKKTLGSIIFNFVHGMQHCPTT